MNEPSPTLRPLPGPLARALAAFAFLTRLPVPLAERIVWDQATLAGSAAWYPVVGLFYALAGALLWLALAVLGLDPGLSALALLALPYALNRFLHFDGLCDTLDGFLADRSPEQRLDIMKDSRNGSFALGGGVLVLLGKYLALRALLDAGALPVVLVAPVLVRGLVVWLAARNRYPRPTGTAAALVGRIPGRTLAAATLAQLPCLALAVAAGCGAQVLAAAAGVHAALPGAIATGPFGPVGHTAIPAAAALAGAIFFTLWLGRAARKAIGGVTGDVLGCLVEAGELAAWTAAALALGLLARVAA